MPGVLDSGVRDRILAESHGNPLALLELPRGLSATELAFGAVSAAGATPLVHRLEQGFLRQLTPLPRQSRRLLLAAAAEPVGDVPLLWRAVQRLGIRPEAASAAEAAGLIELRDRARFRHPLVRSAVYRSATPAERREVHRALADVTDPDVDPDRRAWHRARAACDPDEAVAAELERSAGSALAHGGVAAAAAFLEQAAALTPDPARRVRRALDGAQSQGARRRVRRRLGPRWRPLRRCRSTTPRGHAIDLVRAEISFATNRGNEALPLLLAAGRAARAARREARAGHLPRRALRGAVRRTPRVGPRRARQVAEAVRKAPPPEPTAHGSTRCCDGARRVVHRRVRAVGCAVAHRAVAGVRREELTLDEALRFSWLAAATAASLWDDACWDVLSRRHLEVVRRTGALSALPLALHTRCRRAAVHR